MFLFLTSVRLLKKSKGRVGRKSVMRRLGRWPVRGSMRPTSWPGDRASRGLRRLRSSLQIVLRSSQTGTLPPLSPWPVAPLSPMIQSGRWCTVLSRLDMAARFSSSSPKMGLIVVAEAARYRGGLRDRIVVRLANVLLKFASKQYRELLAEVISHGFDAAAREAGHLRGNPPFT